MVKFSNSIEIIESNTKDRAKNSYPVIKWLPF